MGLHHSVQSCLTQNFVVILLLLYRRFGRGFSLGYFSMMKKLLTLLFIAGLFFGEIQAQNADEKLVSQSFDRLIVAMIKADAADISQVVSEDLSYGHSSGVIQDKAGFVQEVVSKNPMSYQTIERESETVQVSGNTAIMRNVLIIRGLGPTGDAINIRLATLMVWKKEKKQWRLYARQGFRLPT